MILINFEAKWRRKIETEENLNIDCGVNNPPISAPKMSKEA